MNDNFKLDISYIAGLFDGRGSIYYKQVIEKRKTKNPIKVWKIRMEMPLINGDITPFQIHTRYNELVPHTNVSFDDESKTVTLEIGTGVVRETETGILFE